jgi:hypothetical protein
MTAITQPQIRHRVKRGRVALWPLEQNDIDWRDQPSVSQVPKLREIRRG